MDVVTWDDHAEYRQTGIRSRNSPEQFLPYLTEDEISLYKTIHQANERLEQEKISQAYVNARLLSH